ncbi:MAG: acyltransferase [Planctomycetota bacterium]|jgi:acetyltransferase-like isoleucine patch superfamily enzyme
MENSIIQSIKNSYKNLCSQMKEKYQRHVSFGDLFTDRWETAKNYGFGEGSSCYDNVLILGDVKVGKNTWIGPNCILDGSGGLEIGDYCSISAGVQIYSHHTVKWANSMGEEPVENSPVKIGSGVYIGPQSVIQMGVCIGDKAVIGACSFINKDIPAGAKAWGTPAVIQDDK